MKNFKKNVAMLIACALLFTSLFAIPVFAEESNTIPNWSDVDEENREVVEFLYNAGIVNGKSNSEFGVNDPLTKEMACQLVYRYAMYNPTNFVFGATTEDPLANYKDVDLNKWYSEAVRFCIENDILTGDYSEIFGIGRQLSIDDFSYAMWEMELPCNSNTEFASCYLTKMDACLLLFDSISALNEIENDENDENTIADVINNQIIDCVYSDLPM